MKKSLLALAVFGAFAGTAAAQVTIYGAVDANYSIIKNTDSNGVETETRGLRDGNDATSSSRWGIRGTQDLGNGMKANFALEQALNMTNGSIGTATGSVNGATATTTVPSFNRRAVVGVSSTFGSINLGLEYLPIYNFTGSTDVFGNTGYSVVNRAGPNTQAFALRRGNSINYENSFGPVKAHLQLANENTETGGATSARSRALGLGLVYANGPLMVGGAYDRTTGLASAAENTFWAVGGTYDLRVVKLFTNYINGETETNGVTGGETSEINVGVSAPLGAVTLLASAGRNKREVGGVDTTGNDWALGANYSLSKTTYLYARTGRYATLGQSDRSGFSVGMRHQF